MFPVEGARRECRFERAPPLDPMARPDREKLVTTRIASLLFWHIGGGNDERRSIRRRLIQLASPLAIGAG